MYAERGATVLTTFASIAEPILTAASKIPGGAEQVALEKAIDTYVHTTRISSIKTYIYPKEYFFNSEYHLLTETSALRTKATATDLIHYFDALKGGTK